MKSESRLLEFKRQMYELDKPAERTELAKDVTAIANGLGENETGFIVLGLEDPQRGGQFHGVDEQNPDQVYQILESLTNPVPRVHYESIAYRDMTIAVLAVQHSPDKPFWIVRDPANKLKGPVVYLRRGSIITFAKSSEIETMVLKKRSAAPESEVQLIQAGVAEWRLDASPPRIVAAVRNSTAAAVSGVGVSLDVSLPVFQGAFLSQPGLRDARLEPGETREVSFQIRISELFKDGRLLEEQLTRENWVWYRWLDCKLIVQYRDRDGFLRQNTESICIRG